jgi:hypothetical protein
VKWDGINSGSQLYSLQVYKSTVRLREQVSDSETEDVLPPAVVERLLKTSCFGRDVCEGIVLMFRMFEIKVCKNSNFMYEMYVRPSVRRHVIS